MGKSALEFGGWVGGWGGSIITPGDQSTIALLGADYIPLENTS